MGNRFSGRHHKGATRLDNVKKRQEAEARQDLHDAERSEKKAEGKSA